MEEEPSSPGSPDIVSVLKPPRPRIPLKDIMSAANDDDNTANRRRRVSFANVNKIKEFSAVAESIEVCHTPAYEEPFSMSSDSSYPSGVDGTTPAKGMFVHTSGSSEQKEQFPPQPGATYLRNSIGGHMVGMSDNSSLHFPTYRQSLGDMDLADCIDNHFDIAGSSTRYSVGMDLTNVQGGLRNSTRYSMGMDLTNAAARNSTRYSVGMDLTSVVGQDSRMSLSSGAMDFTKAAMSQQLIADQSAYFNPGGVSDVNLNSSGLEMTEAIKDPLLFASLYTVNKAENTRYSMNAMEMTNCAGRKSTRYSLVNMDLTDTISEGNNSGLELTEVINNPNIENMSTRYSLSNMELTEAARRKSISRFSTNSNYDTISEGNNSGLELTEVINNPIIENISTRYSLSNMELTEAARNKSISRFSTNSNYISEGNNSGLELTEVVNNSIIENMTSNMELTDAAKRKSVSRLSTNSNHADISGFNLEYSANSESSMNFTKPIGSSDLPVKGRASVLASNISELSTGMNVQEPIAVEKKISLNEEEGTSKAVTSNQTYVMPETLMKPVESQIKVTTLDEHEHHKLDRSSFKSDSTKLIPSNHTTIDTNLNALMKDPSIQQNINLSNESQHPENNELQSSKTNANEVLLNNQSPPSNETFAINNNSQKLLQPHDDSLLINSTNSSAPSESSFTARNVRQTNEPSVEKEKHSEQVIQSSCDSMNSSSTIGFAQPLEPTHNSKRKGRKSMAAGNLEALCSELQDESSILNISAMSIDDENQEGNAMKEALEADKESTNVLSNLEPDPENQEESIMDVSVNESVEILNPIERDDRNRETDAQFANKEAINATLDAVENVEKSCQQISFTSSSSNPSTSSRTHTDVCRDDSLASKSFHVSSVSLDNSVQESFSKKNITLTRGAASRFSVAFPLRDSSMEDELESSLSGEPSKDSVPATPSDTTQHGVTRKGKRSFEVALELENDTEESPVKQVCLSGEDLISNVTAPSFLMETLDIPNETHTNQSHEISIDKTKPNGAVNISTQISPAKTHITLTHENHSQSSALSETPSATNIRINQVEKTDVGNNFSLRIDITSDQNQSSMVQDESINVEIRRTPRKKESLGIPELNVSKVQTSDDDSFGLNFRPTAKKAVVSNRCGLSLQPQRVTPYTDKWKSRPTELFDDLSGKSEEELLKILKSFIGPKENNLFRNNTRIRHVKGNKYVCNFVQNWIQLHFAVDSKGHIIESSYKMSCDESDQPVGELVMQQLITHLPPQTTYELLDQLQAPAFKQLACFGNQLLTICLFHQGKLSGNNLIIQVCNVGKHFWAFVEINVKYHNMSSSDITIAEQRIGELKLSRVREIFNSTEDGPDRLFRFVKELSKLNHG